MPIFVLFYIMEDNPCREFQIEDEIIPFLQVYFLLILSASSAIDILGNRFSTQEWINFGFPKGATSR